jgi:hypothetical protein
VTGISKKRSTRSRGLVVAVVAGTAASVTP